MDEYDEEACKHKKDYGNLNWKKYMKRLHNSIGDLEPCLEYETKCDENGKTWKGAETKQVIKWDVTTGPDGSGITCDDEEHARILSSIVQINERLKRMEKRLNAKNNN